ncbi:hypothetical protein P389DRAFT_177634 [Cystobasidium minutum MCA 4210]|uniref:uncharacterized protein n=1 Tax=Cystobasidium minutum MCA 4210 TaxID=1397322 RepID=UPI0034CE4FE8|eukprot:jgi/Rhomi1/177634/fgenesh1_pg.2_\
MHDTSHSHNEDSVMKNVPSTSMSVSDMQEQHDQPILFYDGSPMHDYLAEVAPHEVPVVMGVGRSKDNASLEQGAANQGGGAQGAASTSAAAAITTARRKSRGHSNASSASSSSRSQTRRKRTSPSRQPSSSRSRGAGGGSDQSKRPSTTSSAATTAMTDISNDPLFNEAKERLNLLLVSYLSAPHYSALPPQDQECIDRETVNAFLLDERFQQGYTHSGIAGGIRRRRRRSYSASQHGASLHAQQQRQEGASLPPPQARLTMTRPAQLFFLGLCSIALLTPALSTASSSTANAASSSGEMTYSAFNELVNAFLPHSMGLNMSTWPTWSNTLLKSAPGVVALTGLTAIFARASSRNSSITPAGRLGASGSAEAEEMEETIRELRKLFNVCKKFIDECTRLDITLEKGFTVLSELDRLAGLDEEGAGRESDDDDEQQLSMDAASSFEAGRHTNAPGSNWQDLTAIEARLSSSHPAQYASSPAKHTRNRKTRRQQRRIPALPVRQAVFASLYTIQDRLEKDLDSLAKSLDTASQRDNANDAEEGIDTLELVRLLDMYNCHPPSYAAQQSANAAQEDEEAAERLYRRTMARRSLSPTPYSEQQQQSASEAAAKLKRRSGLYIPAPPASVHEDPVSSIEQTFGISNEEQIGRRASWAAFNPSHRRQVPSHPSAVQQQAQKVNRSNAPSSPSSNAGGLQNLARNQSVATPPRVRPQSIHFGAAIPSSNNMTAVASSPLANGAREPNSTIKRERRRRSEQLFSLASLQTQNLTSHLGEDEALAQLRSSTSSVASTSSSIGSSAIMRMSTSSQGTSADPVTAASAPTDLYDSPSRPSHVRRTSLGPTVNSGLLIQKQQNRRSRPLSMHELDFGRSLHRASLSHLSADRRTSLDEVPEADSTASHRNAAAAALERRWSAQNTGPVSTSSAGSSAPPPSRPRDRPTTLLQSSPILSSSPARRSPDFVTGSPAASFRSRKQQHQQTTVRPRSKFAVASLRESSEQVSRLERALVCHMLALKYSAVSSKKLRRVLVVLINLVEQINACINAESTSLTQTMWEEFEDGPAKVATEGTATTAPPTSVLLATPMTSNSAFQSTPRRGSFIACLPGSYPSSPIIEVDPATPPSDTARHTPQGSFFRQFDEQDSGSMQAQVQQNFAPRDPFSPAEQTGKKALAESHAELNAALRSIATKLYMERQDLREYFNGPRLSPEEVAAQQYTMQQLEARQESLKVDLQKLMRAWEEGCASLRQIKEGRQRRIQGPGGPRRTADRQEASSDLSEYDNAEEEPSLMSASAELEKHGSISSVLSSGNEDSLSTPALSPVTSATYQPLHVSDLLLDSTDPAHLPRYGMQEQLFEAYVGRDDDQLQGRKAHGKLSREERIALAKAKRLESQEKEASKSDPQANAELISELKDMVALLR